MRTNTARLFRRLIGVCVLLTVLGAAIYAQDAPKKVTRSAGQGAATTKVQPEYPSIARQLKIEGAVEWEAVVSESGAVEKVNIVSGKGVRRTLFKNQLETCASHRSGSSEDLFGGRE